MGFINLANGSMSLTSLIGTLAKSKSKWDVESKSAEHTITITGANVTIKNNSIIFNDLNANCMVLFIEMMNDTVIILPDGKYIIKSQKEEITISESK